MKDFFIFLKGFAIGAANVVPGVSGGTIAFITGIYERLINAVKGFNVDAVKLLMKRDFKGLWTTRDLRFLITLMVGGVVSVVSLAKVLETGFDKYPVLVWATFFGLILASVPMVGVMVKKWTPLCVGLLLLGGTIAVSMAFVEPAPESKNFFYLMLCGVVAMCSMIIPGLSGSFVLLLLGNYKLIMIDSINALRCGELGVLFSVFLPVGFGAIIGLLSLSRFLGWLFKNHSDRAVSLITGFIAGSLVVIWPWKTTLYKTFTHKGEEKTKIAGYENWHLPDFGQLETWYAIGLMFVGAVLVVLMEKMKPSEEE